MSFMSDVMTMEYDRTGGYGYDYDDELPVKYKKCPNCGTRAEYVDRMTLIFSGGKCVGCARCLTAADEYGQEMRLEGVY